MTDLNIDSITVEYSDGSETVTSGYTVENITVTDARVTPINIKYFGATGIANITVCDSFSVHIGCK